MIYALTALRCEKLHRMYYGKDVRSCTSSSGQLLFCICPILKECDLIEVKGLQKQIRMFPFMKQYF